MKSTLVKPATGGGRMLLLIVGVLLLPFVIGGGLYASGWQPAPGRHYGQLIQPPQALPDSVLRSTGKTPGKWLLILEVHDACSAECLGALDELRRIQVSMNKSMLRLQRVLLAPPGTGSDLDNIRRHQPDLLIASLPPGAPGTTGNRLLVVDPDGWLVMTYPPATPAPHVRADLERLLKFSWSG